MLYEVLYWRCFKSVSNMDYFKCSKSCLHNIFILHKWKSSGVLCLVVFWLQKITIYIHIAWKLQSYFLTYLQVCTNSFQWTAVIFGVNSSNNIHIFLHVIVFHFWKTMIIQQQKQITNFPILTFLSGNLLALLNKINSSNRKTWRRHFFPFPCQTRNSFCRSSLPCSLTFTC